MNAAIDAGNTRIKVGLFDKDHLTNVIVFPAEPVQHFYTDLATYHFDNCIISSVIDLPLHVLSYLKIKSGCLHVLGEQSKLPVTITYKTPRTLGKDRVALAAAGAAIYPGKDVLIISAGTCITYNFVTAKGNFTGGAISPGLHMRLQAMHDGTAGLPLADMDTEPQLVGHDTISSLVSGAVNGTRFEIEGYINEFKKTHKNCAVILSGGDSRYLAGKLSIETDIQPDLALEGLNIILKLNAPEKN